jgi:hypothetical protein
MNIHTEDFDIVLAYLMVGIQLKHRIATRETLQSMRKVLITEMSGIYGLLVRANNMPAE